MKFMDKVDAAVILRIQCSFKPVPQLVTQDIPFENIARMTGSAAPFHLDALNRLKGSVHAGGAARGLGLPSVVLGDSVTESISKQFQMNVMLDQE
jgi:hypothetical protein